MERWDWIILILEVSHSLTGEGLKVATAQLQKRYPKWHELWIRERPFKTNSTGNIFKKKWRNENYDGIRKVIFGLWNSIWRCLGNCECRRRTGEGDCLWAEMAFVSRVRAHLHTDLSSTLLLNKPVGIVTPPCCHPETPQNYQITRDWDWDWESNHGQEEMETIWVWESHAFRSFHLQLLQSEQSAFVTH